MADKISYYDLGLTGEEIKDRLEMAIQNNTELLQLNAEINEYYSQLEKLVFGETSNTSNDNN